MGVLRTLINLFPHEDIGWKEINETFVRYTLLKTPWFRIYIHNLVAVEAHPHCHDHPWSFVAYLLKGRYWEFTPIDNFWHLRVAGDVLLRPAMWRHNVVTEATGMWSLVVTGPKRHGWGFKDCSGS